jgi:hypothetical protein
MHKRASKENHESLDIIKLLTSVFISIQMDGTEETNFAEGWMCPIYRKKDKCDISNYRPITVLNTDYKILTKALTTQLARVAPSMIHPDQAGFMAGRSILDQVELSKTIIALAEASKVNGAIIALDQEKAYDKIHPDYLFKAMATFGIPDTFIRTVKHLYETAETTVIINGIQSAPFKITRGVRQGDPL